MRTHKHWCAQVLGWFLDHQEENGLPVSRIKNKFALASDELVPPSPRRQ
jgi:hypothetical protein